jgi:Calcineurin-like phosphoesterase superfamily domain
MRTLIISDLHLGSVSRADLLRRPDLRAALLEALSDVDRLVLLGDVLELRHGPPREALAAAQPVFEDLGRVLGDGELIITAGNHDHALVEPWLAARSYEQEQTLLEPEQLIEPALASALVARLAEWAAPARVRVAYPGLWVRPDVYATHGHYLDCHLTIPTLERLSVGVMSRVLKRPLDTLSTIEDYEAVTAPMYAWRQAVARDSRTGNALNGIATVDAWRALGGGGSPEGAPVRRRPSLKRWLRREALVRGFPLAVAGLNRAGLGPLRASISPVELRRAGLRAIGEVTARLDLAEQYVVFGHTHRAGPLPDDQPAEWLGPGANGATGSRARLVNAGNWTYSPVFLSGNPGESPYWPGTCVLVEDSGPPLLTQLLAEYDHEQLAPQQARATG